MKKFYLTTPIYYVNDEPHIGHTYTTVIADVISRYYKNLEYNTFFLTGTDEHGAKIEQVAKKSGYEPRSYCDIVSAKFRDAWSLLDIKYDKFIRTTSQQHKDTVKLVLKKLYDKGLIYKSIYEGLYCIQCEKFISKSELVDDKCPDHDQTPIFHKEENYFFRLSFFKDIIYKKIYYDEIKIFPQERKNEILGKLEIQLEDISISRKAVKWAIDLPFDKEQTVYVWIDALINYLSGIDYFNLESSSYKNFWPADVHIIGKDILWFHSVIWPAILVALDLELPKKVLSHGFFTIDGKKMSKTLGNVIKPLQLVEIFGIDATRMLLISNFPLGIDGDFSLDALKDRYNKELADNFGNLVSRTFGMLEKYFNNSLKVNSPSEKLKEKFIEIIEEYKTAMNTMYIHKIAQTILNLSSYANCYIQEKTPWVLFKNNEIDQLKKVMSDLLLSVKVCSLLFLPVMPSTSRKVLECFREFDNYDIDFKKLIENYEVKVLTENFDKPPILFKKI
ncbi:MAG: methionine--tRNA ligase [Endomicrobia bacterium]|nr:methionine--tRNA ligase [Endomicrobiia bacterium]